MSADREVFAEMIQKAAEKMVSARLLLANNRFDDAVSRAYYAVFYVISALLLSKDLVYSSHSQVIGAFNRVFIKGGVLPQEFAVKTRNLFILRQSGDYSIDPMIDGPLAEKSVADAEVIVRHDMDYLRSAGNLDL